VNVVLENLERVWTYEEYAGLDDAVFEIIAGKAIMSPSPELCHQFWPADVANHALEVLTLKTAPNQLSSCATGEGKIHSTILPGFELDLAQLD